MVTIAGGEREDTPGRFTVESAKDITENAKSHSAHCRLRTNIPTRQTKISDQLSSLLSKVRTKAGMALPSLSQTLPSFPSI